CRAGWCVAGRAPSPPGPPRPPAKPPGRRPPRPANRRRANRPRGRYRLLTEVDRGRWTVAQGGTTTTDTGSAPPATPPAVLISGLSHRYGQHQAVTGLDLQVAPGEVFGLLGPNGAGKTTTLRILVTLLRPQTGQVQVFGHDVRRRTMLVRQLIGYVPQQLSADPTLTGRGNVLLFARLFDVPRRQRRQRVDEALELMGLTEVAGRPVGGYSGGMVRRLELAQALVNRPRLLVLDEPTL